MTPIVIFVTEVETDHFIVLYIEMSDRTIVVQSSPKEFYYATQH